MNTNDPTQTLSPTKLIETETTIPSRTSTDELEPFTRTWTDRFRPEKGLQITSQSPQRLDHQAATTPSSFISGETVNGLIIESCRVNNKDGIHVLPLRPNGEKQRTPRQQQTRSLKLNFFFLIIFLQRFRVLGFFLVSLFWGREEIITVFERMQRIRVIVLTE